WRCVPIPGEGEFCDSVCGDGLLCVPEGALRVCRKEVEPGGECSSTFQCGGVHSKYACDTWLRCSERPASGPCLSTYQGDLCDPETSYCDFLSNPPICVPYSEIGQECIFDEECGWSREETICERGRCAWRVSPL